MKKLIFLIMIAITMAAQGSNPVSSTRRIMQQTDGATYFTDYSDLGSVKMINHNSFDKRQNAPEGEEIEVPIEITIDTWSEKTFFAFAIPSFIESSPILYRADMERNGKGNFTLPEGTYDILIVGHSQNGTETVLLTYTNLSIDKNTIVEGSFEDAQISVDIIPKGPDGTVIRDDSDDSEGNITTYSQNLVMNFKTHSLIYETTGFRISTNQISERFSFTRIDYYLWTEGVTNMILPIDFSKTEISPTLSNWQTANVNFCQTPLNANQGKLPDSNPFTLSYALLANNEGCILASTMGTRLLHHNENKIDFWNPEDYNSEYEMWVFPVGSGFIWHPAFDPSIKGMPLRRSENGLQQVGFNPSNFLAYNCTSDGFEFSGNPRYSGEIQYNILGNCAPILVTMPDVQVFADVPKHDTFSFTYTGRYGEDMQIDATGYPEWMFDWSAELRKELGLPVCDVSVDVNGERICDSIDNWWDFIAIPDSGRFDAEISTDNILIDETISGLSTAKIHYDSNVGNGTSPTLTALQFRNNNDKVTDRLDSPSDGFLEFYALAPIEKRWEKDGRWGTYYDTGELESVKAEWSPMGQDNWKEIDLEEIPELFYMPGFGYCFRGYLNDVDKESDNKWYDLRVRVEDAYGAYQEQTISPAFRIESIAQNGIPSVSATSKAMTVYTIDGTTVMKNATETDLKSLPSGLYLVRTGNNTRKIAIP